MKSKLFLTLLITLSTSITGVSRELSGHIGVDFVTSSNNSFSIRKMDTLTLNTPSTIDFFSSRGDKSQPMKRYSARIIINELNGDAYTGSINIFDRTSPTEDTSITHKFNGILYAKSESSFQNDDYQLTLILTIDKKFTREEIKNRFKTHIN